MDGPSSAARSGRSGPGRAASKRGHNQTPSPPRPIDVTAVVQVGARSRRSVRPASVVEIVEARGQGVVRRLGGWSWFKGSLKGSQRKTCRREPQVKSAGDGPSVRSAGIGRHRPPASAAGAVVVVHHLAPGSHQPGRPVQIREHSAALPTVRQGVRDDRRARRAHGGEQGKGAVLPRWAGRLQASSRCRKRMGRG